MPKSKARILVVDDESDLRELLTDALDGTGVEVRAAASANEAIELLRDSPVDFVVTDLYLGDRTGLEVLDALRNGGGDVPAIVITGRGDVAALSEASRRRPVELMVKPLDVERLRSTIRRELTRRRTDGRWRRRALRLRRLAKSISRDREKIVRQLQRACADLADARLSLCGQVACQQVLLDYQHDLLAATNDDDVFRALFRLVARRSGPVFGVAMVCDADAELRIIGRFGVPNPDSLKFCELITAPIVDALLADPQCLLLDATDRLEMFDRSIRKYLVGVTVLGVPLIPAAGEMIGAAVFYRKGEQPFTDTDVALAEALAAPTAIVIRRND